MSYDPSFIPGVANPYAGQLAASLGGVPPNAGQYFAGGGPYSTIMGGAAPAAAVARGSWMGGIGADLAAGGGLAGRAAGLLRSPAGPGLLGYAATQGLNALLPSTGGTGNVREVLADAATGAGLGGTIGSFIAPGVGTAVGAGLGGAAGGLYGLGQNLGWFGTEGDTSKDLRSSVEGAAKQLGVSPGDYTGQYDLAVKAGMTDPTTGKKLSNEQIASLLGAKMSQEVTTTRAQKEASANALAMHQADLQSNLALQTQAQQFMSPYINNIISAGASQAKVLNNLADQMPAAYKGVFQSQAANALNTAQQTAGAYMGQLAIQPAMQIMNTYDQQQQAQMANMAKIYQAAAQMRQGGGAGGGVDFSQLGQQQAPAASPYG